MISSPNHLNQANFSEFSSLTWTKERKKKKRKLRNVKDDNTLCVLVHTLLENVLKSDIFFLYKMEQNKKKDWHFILIEERLKTLTGLLLWAGHQK